jgi:peptidoglycan/LPS O-acetylase OafA/YrhL
MHSPQIFVAAHSNYRQDIDGLRAIAVIAVVLFHAFPNEIPGGFIGVDVFFVISGYLITQIILTDLTAGTFSAADFYARRVRRIFPALIIVLIASLALGWRLLLPTEMISLGKNAVASALFSANLMLLSEVGYFDLAARVKPLLHLWSLGIEEQFYLAWPLILCALPRRWIAQSIILLILGSFALNVSLVSSHPAETFYLPFTRAWELLVGSILLQISKPRGFANEALSLVGFSILSGTIFLFDKNTTFPGWAAALPVIGTASILLAEGSVLNRVMLTSPAAVGIGLISYPLYLWHWPLLVFFELHKFIRPPTDIERALIVCLSVLLAWLTFTTIERPIRSRSKFVAKPLLGAMTAVIAVSLLPAFGYVPPLPEAIARLITLPNNGAGWRRECVLSDSDILEFPPSCVDRKRPLIAIWGDSTAAALIPGFQKLQETSELGIAQFTVSSCPPLLVRVRRVTSPCLQRNQHIVTLIGAASPDIVILQAYWSDADTIETIKPTIDALRANNIANIVILGSVPVWHGGLPGAVASFFRLNGSVIPPRVQQYVDSTTGESSMLKIANTLGVKYISARDAFCNTDGCLTRVGNSLTASDTIHLTTAGSELLVQTIAPKLGFTSAISLQKPDWRAPE